ncbi:MAG: alcohol dehydrogenase [Henriciella sp.]|mgnify:CR=1 FL=1|uniref:NAD(P)-dependent alcohol dehydrogenase n=1 Tax=uncultured Henriciella sp. TaxID=1608424 RepID=UPI000C58F3A1|nr:alcohol dehydrogenase [Henriciella sp.]MBF34651.1 alcohol dehydrogenase [Hyphomonadaceae bacterium]
MPQKARAAIVDKSEAEFRIADVEIDEPGPHEVRVKLVATGLCHTDLAVRDGVLPANFPVVLGHEGAGVVEAAGAHVHDLKEGDRVVLSYGSCGDCRPCMEGDPAYCDHFTDLNFLNKRLGSDKPVLGGEVNGAFFQQSSFATFAIAHERNVVKVPDEAPLKLLGPLGCGIQTGAGAVLNTLAPRAGTSIAVSGVGSVGLSAVMAAKLAGCHPIIAIDMQEERLKLASELGATHTINAGDGEVPEMVRKIAPEGVDAVIECSGAKPAARAGWAALANRGSLLVVGAPPGGTDYDFDANEHILSGRKIVGCVEGDSVVKVFIPRLIQHYLDGNFPFDRLVSEYPFEDINKAVHDMEEGKAIKPVLIMDKDA